MKTKFKKGINLIKTHKKEIAIAVVSVVGTCVVLKCTGVIPSGKYIDLVKHLEKTTGDGVDKFIELASRCDGIGVIEYNGNGRRLKELGELGEKIREVINIGDDPVLKGLTIFVEE